MINLSKSSINLTKQSSFDLLKTSPGSLTTKQILTNDIGDLANLFNIPIVPAMDNLEPIGNSPFMSTPGEPADPEDCAAWPDSPYCNGNPFTFTPIGIDVSMVLDQCNIGIQLVPQIAFINLPPIQIVYHSTAPECQPTVAQVNETTEEIELPDIDGEFWLTIIPSRTYSKLPILNQDEEVVYSEVETTCTLTGVDTSARNNTCVALTFSIRLKGKYAKSQVVADTGFLLSAQELGSAQYYNPPVEHPRFPGYSFIGNYGIASLQEDGKYYLENVSTQRTLYIYKYDLDANFQYSDYKTARIQSGGHFKIPEFGDTFFSNEPKDIFLARGNALDQAMVDFYFNGEGIAVVNEPSVFMPVGKAGLIERFKSRSVLRDVNVNLLASDEGHLVFPPFGSPAKAVFSSETKQASAIYIQEYTVAYGTFDAPLPPPPPLPMQCCPSPFDPALLQLILANQNKIMKTIGVNEYPASLPASLISKDEGFLGNLIPNANVEIQNLTQMCGWFIERFDEIMGMWEIPIEVKDSDPTVPGDQPKGFRLSNLAEAVAELIQLQFQTYINSEIAVNAGVRTLLESGQIKQQDFKNYMLTQTIADYFGYNYKEVQKDLPLSFTPGETALDKLLVESTLKVAVAEINDQNTFQKALIRLLEAAAITKSKGYTTLDTKGGADPKQAFKDRIKAQAAILKKLSDDEVDADGDDNLDRFIKEARIGFKDAGGTPLTNEPYGRNFEERPDIERIN